MVKVYEIGAQEGLDSLRRAERAPAEPGPGQALLRVRAVCLNHRDLLIVSGRYGPRRPAERVPVSDGIGEVLALGPGAAAVPGLVPGQRVICPHFVNWLDGDFSPGVFAADLGVTLDGWLAEQIVVPASALVVVPDTLSDSQAAALPAAGLTAWNALVEVGRVLAGERVLLLGTGGVSMLALQIARLCGARVAITSSSDDKLARARALGADITINMQRQPDWAAALLQADPAGADLVLETGGMASLSTSISAAAPNGRIVLIGALGAPAGLATAVLPNFSSIIGKNLQLRGITAGSRSMLARLLRAAAAQGLSPVIDREFGFDEAAQAYAHLASGQHLGKVLIRC
jgi:NADPH:quinone reductase-like Zn-dependent oxidoreductase